MCAYSSPSYFPLSGFTPSVVPDRQRRVAGRSAAWGFFRLRLLPCCWPWEIDFTAQAGPRDPNSHCCQTACPLTPCITQVTGRRSPRLPAQRQICCHFVRPKVNHSHVLITGNFIKLETTDVRSTHKAVYVCGCVCVCVCQHGYMCLLRPEI